MAVSFRISKWVLFVTHVLSVVFPCVRNTSLYAHPIPEDLLDQDVQEWDREDEENPISEERTSNCSRCIEKEERRAMRIQTIKNQILTQLGMREAPNVTQRDLPHIPPLDNLLDNYNMQADSPTFTPGPEYGDEDDFYITAEKVLAFSQTPPEPVDVASGDKQLYFKLSTSLRNAQVQNAHLWVYIRPTRHVYHRNITLYEINQSSFGQAEFIQIRRKSLDKKNKRGNWLVFDVKKTVTNWLKHPEENFGFSLHSSGADVQRLIVTPEENCTENMGPPDGQPEPYQIGDGIIPPFRGESVSKQTHQPQPPIRQLPAYKPPEEKPPMLLGPKMMEVESYSNWSYKPLPLELARKTRPVIPNWVLKMKKPLKYETRFDLTSSYQEDYCGPKTKTRKICLDSENGGKVDAGGDIANSIQRKENTLTNSGDCTQLEDRMWNHIHSLLFRTTTGSTYLPPSIFGGSPCHPAKSRLEGICPANALATKTCKIHQNQKF